MWLVSRTYLNLNIFYARPRTRSIRCSWTGSSPVWCRAIYPFRGVRWGSLGKKEYNLLWKLSVPVLRGERTALVCRFGTYKLPTGNLPRPREVAPVDHGGFRQKHFWFRVIPAEMHEPSYERGTEYVR